MNSMRARAFALLLVAGFASAAAAADAAGGRKKEKAAAAAPSPHHAVFGRERASQDARSVAEWVIASKDNDDLPFAILDKKDAKVFVFHPDGRLRGAAPALLGLGRGDVALAGIGARALSDIAPNDRVTQAGRFVADLGVDYQGEDVLWLDYEGGLAMHRVITTNLKEQRAQRLATATPLDNRISYGCINLPVKFYEKVVQPAFTGTKGIVYVLPETREARAFFASGEAPNTLARPMRVVNRPEARTGATGN
jgi:hypothetical protein